MRFGSQLNFLEVRFPQKGPKESGGRGGGEKGKEVLKIAQARKRDLKNIKTYPNFI